MRHQVFLFPGEPRRKSGLFCSVRIALSTASYIFVSGALVFLLSLFLASCGATAPRFRTGEKKASATGSGKSVAAEKGAAQRGKLEDREEKAAEAESVLSGERSFKTEKNSAISNLDQAKMMREISKMMGVSYKLGGEDQEGIDCSAYAMVVYRNSIGRVLPRTSTEQFKTGSAVANEDLKFGDLVFFNTTGEPASHVGIYLGDSLFAHASTTLGVTISSLESFYYKKRYDGARRIVR
jgi:cell wall-associated NlpC family hydrolase